MAKVLSMQVGQNVIRLAEVTTKGKKATITKIYTFDIDEEASKDGKVRVSDEVVTTIRSHLIASGISAQEVYFTVESTRILFKAVEIPYVNKNMIQSTLDLSFSDLFNVDESLYHISFVNRGPTMKNEQKMLALEVFAVPNDISESFYNLAVSLGLSPQGISDTSHGIMTLLEDEFQHRNVATVNIEENTSSLAIVVNGEMVFNKTIAQGIAPAMDIVQHYAKKQGGQLNNVEALEQLYTNNILLDKLPEGITSQTDDAMTRYEATQSLSRLIKTIETTFTQYLSKENIQIQEFILTGLGSGVANISKLMSREFGIPVKVIQQGKSLTIDKNIASEVLLVSAYPLAGAINDPTNFFNADEKAGGKVAKNKQIDKIALWTGLILGVAGLGFGAYRWLVADSDHKDVMNEYNTLSKRVDTLRAEGLEAKYAEYTAAYSYFEEIKNLYTETESINDDMVVFLEDLENNLPIGASVLSLELTPTQAKITFQAENNTTAAGTLHLLRNMKTIAGLSCQGFGENPELHNTTFEVIFTLKTGEELQGLMDEETGSESEENGSESEENAAETPEGGEAE